MGLATFGAGGVASIRRSKSSNPIPLGSSAGGFPGSSDRFGGGLEGFPDLVAGDLGTVGQPLAGDARQDHLLALHVAVPGDRFSDRGRGRII